MNHQHYWVVRWCQDYKTARGANRYTDVGAICSWHCWLVHWNLDYRIANKTGMYINGG